jgi:hypothetical protein
MTRKRANLLGIDPADLKAWLDAEDAMLAAIGREQQAKRFVYFDTPSDDPRYRDREQAAMAVGSLHRARHRTRRTSSQDFLRG